MSEDFVHDHELVPKSKRRLVEMTFEGYCEHCNEADEAEERVQAERLLDIEGSNPYPCETDLCAIQQHPRKGTFVVVDAWANTETVCCEECFKMFYKQCELEPEMYHIVF